MEIKEKIQLSDTQISSLREIQIELLNNVDDFCKKNNITYFLCAGTLLGSLRHQGYIPWDDDLDIMMDRSNYDKFCSLYKENESYFLQTPDTDNKYTYHFSKLLKKGTIYNEFATQNVPSKKGIFIDIFPINGVPDRNAFVKFHYYFWLFILNKKAYPKEYIKFKKNKKTFSYKLLTVISWLLLWWAPSNLCAKMRNNFMKRHQFSNSNLCIVGSDLRRKYKKDYFSKCGFAVFEGKKYPIPAEFDKYLTDKFGSWRSFPPESERIPHHFLVEFNDGKKTQ